MYLHYSEMMGDEFFSPFMDELQIGIYLFNHEGKTLQANSNFQRMLGYRSEELQSKTIEELFAKDDVLFLKKGPGERENRTIITGNRRKGATFQYNFFPIKNEMTRVFLSCC